MLLETLDIKKNDIIIFSQNTFNLENNFKIIFKDDPQKKIRRIGFADVCKFVNEYTPKNLIAYRLLTNIRDFEIDLIKYGSFISLNDTMELIYFDPVYAVKELEDYAGRIEGDLRFRIQQIGLTTISRRDNIANFTEIYSVDLYAEEARNQNDGVFADVIFAKDASYRSGKNSKPDHEPAKNTNVNKEQIITEIREQNKIVNPVQTYSEDRGIKFINHDISEDNDFDYKQVLRMNNTQAGTSRFSKFISEKGNESEGTIEGIFKSQEPIKELLHDREDKKVVLKLNSD